MRLIVALATQLGPDERIVLEQAILAGPPRAMFQADADPPRLQWIADREIWKRLTKYRIAGAQLGANAAARLDAIAQQHPNWQLDEEQRDEFPFWMGDGEDWREFIQTPLRRDELITWLREHPEAGER